ncbi:MAG: hypothetical protein GKR88_14580 [Flavobacteriaceae bacterium]|nr:MAG: hypothetical protein GKR88_14580 [Flavobacteriaceae bacterium]
MENKLDKEFRKKLQTRKIQPSASAWERLSYQLNYLEEKKKRGRFLYIGYAASVLLMISLFFFLNDTSKNEKIILENTIVKKDMTIPQIDKQKVKEVVKQEDAVVTNSAKRIIRKEVADRNIQEGKLSQVAVKQLSTAQKNLQKELVTDLKVQKKVFIPQKEKQTVVETRVNKDGIWDKETNFKETNYRISVSSDALLYAVTHTKEEVKKYYQKYKVSRAAVLKAIEKELQKTNLKIDPKIILAEVERDVREESFQNNFYQFIKKRVSDVAIAIANRNN